MNYLRLLYISKTNRLLFFSVILLTVAAVTELPAQAERICKVTDPTGTPLNIRDQPNGRVVNSLKNGREVYIQEIVHDTQGRAWARVSGYYKGRHRKWGWVIREFISCYSR